MDAHDFGKLGGRPKKVEINNRITARNVKSGKQSTLQLVNLQFTFNFAERNKSSATDASASSNTNKRKKIEHYDDSDDIESQDDLSQQDTEDDGEDMTSDAKTLEVKLAPKRTEYSKKEKTTILEMLQKNQNNIPATVAEVRQTSGFEHFSEKSLRNWRKHGVKRSVSTGRRVNTAFEDAVLSNLIFAVLKNPASQKAVKDDNAENHALVVANVAHSYEVIRMAAKMAQELPDFADVTADGKKKENWVSVSQLKFTCPWISGFLNRHALRRHRVTAQVKDLPKVEDVRKRMDEIQKVIKDGEYKPEDIISADETGIFFGAPPKFQYVANNERGSVSETNDKARFTALMWGSASGVMGPPFIIVKCNVNKANLESVRVLTNLMKEFGAMTGWSQHMWSRELELVPKGKKEAQKQEYKRPYLINSLTSAIITVQHKAWMDSVGLAMWADLQFGPWATKSGRKKIIVWDNCGPHNVSAVKAVFDEHNVEVCPLPPKMTDILQVMDLVVNGPLKSAIRRARCQALFSSFVRFKCECERELDKPKEQRKQLPLFSPPKPTLAQGLLSLFQACAIDLVKPNFQNGLRRSFVQVGLAPDEHGIYARYSTHCRSTMKAHLAPADSPSDEHFVLGDVAAALEIDSHFQQENDEDEYDEDNDDSQDNVDDINQTN